MHHIKSLFACNKENVLFNLLKTLNLNVFLLHLLSDPTFVNVTVQSGCFGSVQVKFGTVQFDLSLVAVPVQELDTVPSVKVYN